MVRIGALAIFFARSSCFSVLDFPVYYSVSLLILALNVRRKDNFIINSNVKMPDSCRKWPFLTVILQSEDEKIVFAQSKKPLPT